MQHQRTPQRFRTRAELVLIEPSDPDGDRYVIKDPLSLEYYLVSRREFVVLRLLRTPMSVSELRQNYLRQFPGEQRTPEELLSLCQTLLLSQLVISTAPSTSAQSDMRHRQAGQMWSAVLTPLAIRLPSVDPTIILSALAWWGRLSFSATFFAIACVTMLIALIVAIGRIDEMAIDARELVKLSNPHYTLAAILAVVCCKSWHELGHGLACKRFGGACHEMGIMLLAFVPCLYCDASDAWTFPKRTHRAVVAMAGVYFELLLATAALLFYFVASPGFLSVLSLYVVVVASVSTIAININPLMRFDGYYLLSDLWEVPNLYQESRRALWGKLTQWITGDRNVERPFAKPRWLLASYALASSMQTLILLTAILWSLHHYLSDWGWRPLADVIVAISLLSIARKFIGVPWHLWKSTPLARRSWAAAKAGMVAGFVVALAILVSQIPIEQTLWSPCRFERASVVPIAAPLPGTLIESCIYNRPIKSGEVVARLVDPERQLQQMELKASIASSTTQLQAERLLAQREPLRFRNVRALESHVVELHRQLTTVENEMNTMIIRSPIGGDVLRPPSRGKRREDDQHDWTDGPLDAMNEGCGIETGDLLCVVADGPLQAVILLDEADSGLMRIGDDVRIILDRWPSLVIMGKVESVALANVDHEEAQANTIPEVATEYAMRRELQHGAVYRVQVALEETPPIAQHGAMGQARIVTGHESVAGWTARFFHRIVHFSI